MVGCGRGRGRALGRGIGSYSGFGFASGEIIGQPITRIIPTDRRGEETSILKRVSGGEKIVHFETQRQCKDGNVIPVSLTVMPIRNDAGTIVGVSKTARDLTETQRIHRDLERREALLRSVLDTMPDTDVLRHPVPKAQAMLTTPLVWRHGEISPPVLALRTLVASLFKGSPRKSRAVAS